MRFGVEGYLHAVKLHGHPALASLFVSPLTVLPPGVKNSRRLTGMRLAECCVWFEIEFPGRSCQLSISETCVDM